MLTCLIATVLWGETPAKAPVFTEAQLMAAKIKYTLEEDTVIENIRKLKVDIDKGIQSKKPIETMKYASCCSKLKHWLDYPWFIADTGLSKKWLKSIIELIEYMRKTQDYIKTNKHRVSPGDVKYKQAVEYYDVAYKRFVAKISKPEKVSLKIQRQMKVAKVKWQKAMAKKYKIKENF
jgi:hypothetical protein